MRPAKCARAQEKLSASQEKLTGNCEQKVPRQISHSETNGPRGKSVARSEVTGLPTCGRTATAAGAAAAITDGTTTAGRTAAAEAVAAAASGAAATAAAVVLTVIPGSRCTTALKPLMGSAA